MSKSAPSNARTRHFLLGVASLFTLAAAWRGVVAVQHHLASVSVVDDPSMRELEEVSALFEAGMALLLLVHAYGLFVLSARRIELHLPGAAAIAMLCTAVVSGAMLGLPVFTAPGAYVLSIVAGTAIVSYLTRCGWLSLYLAAVAGCVLAWAVAAPESDLLACLFVTLPGVVYVFLGAGLTRGVRYVTER